MTSAEFKALHPEFETASDARVSANIAAAELETPADVWGVKRDEGIRWLTAHKLSLGPSGMNARKISPAQLAHTVYWHEREKLLRQVAGGPRVY
jgi:hypothetical protein